MAFAQKTAYASVAMVGLEKPVTSTFGSAPKTAAATEFAWATGLATNRPTRASATRVGEVTTAQRSSAIPYVRMGVNAEIKNVCVLPALQEIVARQKCVPLTASIMEFAATKASAFVVQAIREWRATFVL